MIPYILIIAGAASVLCGLIGVIRIAFLPLVMAHQVVFKRKDDYLFYENAKGRRLLKSQKKFLMNIYLTLIITGILVITAGFYAGFTQNGPDFWLYKNFFSLVSVKFVKVWFRTQAWFVLVNVLYKLGKNVYSAVVR